MIGTQVPVQNPLKKKFTQVDVVCQDPSGVHVVIEVKTRVVSMERHETCYREVNPKKPRAYRRPNNLFWRHQMQLKETTEMYRLRNPKVKLAAYVLVIVENRVLCYPLSY